MSYSYKNNIVPAHFSFSFNLLQLFNLLVFLINTALKMHLYNKIASVCSGSILNSTGAPLRIV